jgi:hypothetical protein
MLLLFFLFCYCDFSFYLRSSLSAAVAPAGSDAGTSGSGLTAGPEANPGRLGQPD